MTSSEPKIHCARRHTIEEIPVVRTLNAQSAKERARLVAERLDQLKVEQTSLKRLKGVISDTLRPLKLEETGIDLIVKGLRETKRVKIEGDKVTWARAEVIVGK